MLIELGLAGNLIDFGIQLTNKNTDDVITKLRDERSGYRQGHRNEINHLRRWVDVFVRKWH